jgi:FAD/FMN-containing dehydrogenase
LSIWTRNIRGIDFQNAFQPLGCRSCSPIPAAKIAAGEEWGDIYAAAYLHNLTFVGGTGDSIGIGGYLTGGGHSPLSAFHGLAADQIVEIEVVTASGQFLVANQVQNTDLFWALRGVLPPFPSTARVSF